jgi:hypothetical protein
MIGKNHFTRFGTKVASSSWDAIAPCFTARHISQLLNRKKVPIPQHQITTIFQLWQNGERNDV